MGWRVEDGKGNGFHAGVNDENQLLTQSEIHSETRQHTDDGEVFILGSDIISLTTTGAYSGILYIKNTSTTKNFYIDDIQCQSNGVTCNWRLTRNPTTGTLISNATAGLEGNMNFSNAGVFDGDVYKGADTYTVTDGTTIATGADKLMDGEVRGGIVLGPTNTLAISADPSAAAEVSVVIIGWQATETS